MNRSATAALAALTACAHAPLDPLGFEVPEPPALSDGHIDTAEHSRIVGEVAEDLQRLAALEILSVGQLVVDAPTGSQNCYGPCEDDPTAQVWMQLHAQQAARLGALVEAAESIAESAPEGDWSDTTDAIAALRELRIVEIEGMYYDADGNCYVGQCPGDRVRAGVVRALADRTGRP